MGMYSDDNSSMVATSPGDILKILILERRKFVIDAIEHYNRNRFDNRHSSISPVRAEIISLFLEVQAALKRDKNAFPPEFTYDDLLKKVHSEKLNDLVEAFYFLNEWLDEKKLIRVDTRRVYDSTRAEAENWEKSL